MVTKLLTIKPGIIQMPDNSRYIMERSCELNRGEILGIYGPNGAGKSSLVKKIIKSLQNEKDVEEITCYEKGLSIFYLPQNTSELISPWLTTNLIYRLVQKNLKETSVFQPPDNIRQNIVTGLLSGGEKQIIAIELATSFYSDFFILDEPTSALDNANKHYYLETIKKHIEDNACCGIIILHDFEALKMICSKILIFNSTEKKIKFF